MTEQEIIKKIKILKQIKPEGQFKIKGRNLLLTQIEVNSKSNNSLKRFFIYFSQNPVSVFAFTIVFLTFTFGINQLIKMNSQYKISSIQTKELINEINKINVNKQLEEITYHQNINSFIASALDEIDDTNNLKYLKNQILEKEIESINIKINDFQKGEEIEQLLEKKINQ